MRLCQELEMIREKCGLTVVDVCNIMDITPGQYRRLLAHNRRPSIYQLIMFFNATQTPLYSI